MKRILKYIVERLGFKISRTNPKSTIHTQATQDVWENTFKNIGHKYKLLVIDDFLPNMLGSWRSSEIGGYMLEFKNVQLLSLANLYQNIYDYQPENDFETDKAFFLKKYNQDNDPNNTILQLQSNRAININANLGYCLFINNLRTAFPLFKKNNIPFCFTLYPGGGFSFYNKSNDDFLQKINASSLFKAVIVTQQCTYDYLIDRKIISTEKIHLIYGVNIDLERYRLKHSKKYYNKNKDTLDICFVASKYTNNGIDKGFDVFCHVAFRLSQKYSFIKFHIVGGFSKADILYEINENNLKFYGYQQSIFFESFYSEMDIILSPVKSNVLSNGSFDGFPTGAVMDAGLFNVLMITSDPLNDNIHPDFKNWDEMIITDSNHYSVLEAIEKLIVQPSLIESISTAGKIKLCKLFSKENQIERRIALLKNYIETDITKNKFP